MTTRTPLDRRQTLQSLAAAGAILMLHGLPVAGAARAAGPANRPLQGELDHLARTGGGTLRLSGDQIGGILVVKGCNIVIEGGGHTLFNTRIIVAPAARQIVIRNLNLLDRSGRDDGWHLDISGQDCRLENLKLEKRPLAGGYQAYFRAGSRGCVMRNFTTAGSNGIFVAGSDHLFEQFDMSTPQGGRAGGDDAFAIKGAGSTTSNITIRSGRVRGFAAALSIGSEVGRSPEHPQRGAVIGVNASAIEAIECSRLVFIKPGALIYDWREGLVRDINLTDLSLSDPAGKRFASGIVIMAGRGAVVERVTARRISIAARTTQRGRQHTAAIDILAGPEGAPPTIRDIDLQVAFDGRGSSAQAIDHVAKIEKSNPARGTITGISLDVTGQETRFGGILVGPGIDDSVTLRRVRLQRVAIAPPASMGGGGIWADSRVRLGDVEVSPVAGNRFGGRAAPR